jgi:AraC-like DNA-binding protein
MERTVLTEALGITVSDFRCRARVHPEGPEEHNQTHSIVLVRRGAFVRRVGRARLAADANHVLFFNPHEPYRIAHPVPGGDDCTILSLKAPVARELAAWQEPRISEASEVSFRPGQGLSSVRVARLHYELLVRLRRPSPSLDLEEVLAELVDEAARAGAGRRDDTDADTPTSRVGRRRELTEAIQVLLNERLDAPPSLAELARTFGGSPFHLSRIFRQTAGVGLRAYVNRLRVRAAAERLSARPRDLSAVALGLGYADHSHFAHSFRREWGIPPSEFRARFAG